ncbi:hypothetical protein [Bosea sp. AAP35]|uniref:hypothetical protein n=1 Tax=Bosea sp. AAP35 TaxID=1523417 RepID=UPI0012E2FC93|nr:hypothetical protein [Bosea sp. AAP35]
MKLRYSAPVLVISVAFLLPGCGTPPDAQASGAIASMINRSYANLFVPPKSDRISSWPSDVCSQTDTAKFLESSMSLNELYRICRLSSSVSHDGSIILTTDPGEAHCIKLKIILEDMISVAYAGNTFDNENEIEVRMRSLNLKRFNVNTSCKDGSLRVVLEKIKGNLHWFTIFGR